MSRISKINFLHKLAYLNKSATGTMSLEDFLEVTRSGADIADNAVDYVQKAGMSLEEFIDSLSDLSGEYEAINNSLFSEIRALPRLERAEAAGVVSPELESRYSDWTLGGPKKTPPNFHRVEGGNNNYRSAQPPEEEDFYKFLNEKYGIENIISLNSKNHSGIAGAAGLAYLHVPLGSRPPSRSDWSMIKSLLSQGDTLVHCTHGADRTGGVIGRYKVEEMNVDPTIAHNESLEYGFKSQDHPGWPERCDDMPVGTPEEAAEKQECIDDSADPNKRLRNFIYHGHR